MYGLIKSKWIRDENSKLPLYQQVADFIATCIDNGDIPPNFIFPGHRKLATSFNVSINTMINAIHVLQKKGILKNKPRSKSSVVRNPLKTPDWDHYINSALYNATSSNFFSFADSHVGSLNLSYGLSSAYYFREMFNEVIPNIVIPHVMTTTPLGLPELRQEICKYSVKYGMDLKSEQVMITTSIMHGLNTIFLAMLGHGTNLILPKPSNLSISNLIRTTGANIIEIPMDEKGIIVSKLLRTIQSMNNCILAISPDQNVPTGVITTEDRRKTIVNICAQYKVPIIEHTYMPVGGDLYDIPPLKAFDTTNNVIHVGQIGVAGSTNPWLGWVVGDEYLIKQLTNIRLNLDAHQNYLMQLASHKIFQTGRYTKYIEKLCNTRKQRAKDVNDLLIKYFDNIATWNTENIDSCVWLKFDKIVNTNHLYKIAEGVTFHPGKFYDKDDTTHIFICPVALSLETLEEGLIMLSALVRRTYYY